MPDDNVVQVGEKGNPSGPQAVERPREDLRKNIRGDIEDKGKGVKKVKLAQVREGEVTVKIGPHRDMGIRLGDVERGEERRGRQEARQYHVIVESERGSKYVLVEPGQVDDETGGVCCRGEERRTNGRESKAEAELERPHPCGPNPTWQVSWPRTSHGDGYLARPFEHNTSSMPLGIVNNVGYSMKEKSTSKHG